MPPKAKFTEDELIQAALEIVRERGADALTARSLGEKLQSSARPIFTVFSGMDEVREGVIKKAKALYKEYVDRGLSCKPPFKGVGMEYVAFARNEPKIFQLLFMTENPNCGDPSGAYPRIDDNFPAITQSIVDTYGIAAEKAERLYFHLAVYAHGIASLIATGVADYTDEQIGAYLTEVFVGVMRSVK